MAIKSFITFVPGLVGTCVITLYCFSLIGEHARESVSFKSRSQVDPWSSISTHNSNHNLQNFESRRLSSFHFIMIQPNSVNLTLLWELLSVLGLLTIGTDKRSDLIVWTVTALRHLFYICDCKIKVQWTRMFSLQLMLNPWKIIWCMPCPGSACMLSTCILQSLCLHFW
jgi:hypothetical protein